MYKAIAGGSNRQPDAVFEASVILFSSKAISLST